MNLTPTFKGAFVAGFLVWVLAWTTLFKLDKIPILKRFLDKERILEWVNENRSITLLCTEAINFGVHGVGRPESAIYAVGGTFWNVLMVLLYLPWRQRRRHLRHGDDLLRAR